MTVCAYSFALEYLSYSRGVTATILSSLSDEVCAVCIEDESWFRGATEFGKGVGTLDTCVIDEAASKKACVDPSSDEPVL